MRIALVTDGIWPYVLGGMQKHSYYLCKYLAKRGVEVHLFHFNQSSYDISQLEFFTDEEKKLIRSFIVPFPSSVKFPGHYLYNSYRYSMRVAHILSRGNFAYDFIYTKGFTGWHLLKFKSRYHIQCPVGVNFHGYEMFQRPPDRKTWLQHWLLLRKPVKKISLNADVVFSYGGKITGIIKDLGVPAGKIFELPSGVESSFLEESVPADPSSVIRFVFLGRYERRKGVEELNVAISDFLDGRPAPEAEFHFIGPLPENIQLTNQQVFYHGEVRDKYKLRALLTRCDVLLCPSWSEGMPNVILEAMACGLAVLATDVGATSILVNHKTGWLIPSPDARVIKEKLVEIMTLSSGQLMDRKRNARRLIAEQFTWERLIDVFLSHFKPGMR